MDLKQSYIEDKVFLVTGGAAGVGAGVVRSLLAENARHVAFLDIAEREGNALESELKIKFGALKAKFLKCDISDEVQLDAAYKQVYDKYQRLDGVINNAAILRDDSLCRRMVDVNFTATVSSTLKAMNTMGADKGGGGGLVLNISSLLEYDQTNLAVYAATKTAVLQFTNSVGSAERFAQSQVRVMTVCLGPTDTAIRHRHTFDDVCHKCDSPALDRQKVQSAVRGILNVVSKGENGSTWIIAFDKAAVNVTKKVNTAFDILFKGVIETLTD